MLTMDHPAEVQKFISDRSVLNPFTSCIEWQRGTSSQGGYPTVWLDGHSVYAHRAAYALAHGGVPAGSIGHESSSFEVHHLCGNKHCVNPAHLELVSRHEHCHIHKPIKAAVRQAKAA